MYKILLLFFFGYVISCLKSGQYYGHMLLTCVLKFLVEESIIANLRNSTFTHVMLLHGYKCLHTNMYVWGASFIVKLSSVSINAPVLVQMLGLSHIIILCTFTYLHTTYMRLCMYMAS